MSRGSKISRRQALKRGAAFAAAAVAGPALVPSGILATTGKPGANDLIGIGFIATGRRSAGLQGRRKEGRVVGAADCNLPRAQRVAKRLGGKAYQDYRKLLDSKDVDAVIIASPDHWHALHAVHACQAGKDVYVEKPMTLTIHEGRLLTQAARKYKRIVQCGSQQRSMVANRQACELIRNGRLGKIHTVIAANFPSPWECKFPGQPIPDGLDWDMWCGPTEVVPYHKDIYTPRANPGWISFRPWSGGEVTGWGAHGLDQVQWGLGTDDTGPVEVWTEGEKFDPPTYTKPESRRRGETICRNPKVFCRYASGTILKLDNGPPGGAIFIGDRGKITIDRGRFKCEPEDLAADADKLDTRLYVSNDHMGNWYDCMKSRKLPVADVEIGHRSSVLCHLANIARWLGRKLKWDPENEVFPGDEEANRFIDRSRRKPYELPKEA